MLPEPSTDHSPGGEKLKPRHGPSKAYLKFESVMKRSLDLVALQKPIEKIMALAPDSKPLDLSDMTRAAVVLAVAAMDSYFTDVFAEYLIPFLKKRGATKVMVELLEKAGLDTRYALRLLATKRPYRRIRTLIETHLEYTTTQKVTAIDELFLAYGVKDFSLQVQKMKKRTKLLAAISRLVKRRNMIAHEGDMNSHRKVIPVDPGRAQRWIQDVLVYVSGADELLKRRFLKRRAAK